MRFKINQFSKSRINQKSKPEYNTLTRCMNIFIILISVIIFAGCSSDGGKDDIKVASDSEIVMSDSTVASDIHIGSDSEPVKPPEYESPVTPPDDEKPSPDKEQAKNGGNPDEYFEAVISSKNWTDQVKSLLKEMYDHTKTNYEYRELYDPELNI